jgi:ubiquinone/menaquinone biosynthesis C-methylase UbiE
VKNPWLKIKLSDYENHMSLPNIAQSNYLSEFLEKLQNEYKPNSLALIGCSGGNGLDKINSIITQKIICVDINKTFLKTAEKRYGGKLNCIEFIQGDISSPEFKFAKVDIIYVALVFEYCNYQIAINNLVNSLLSNGYLAVILQMPNENIPEVSPSPYKSLGKLSNVFSFVNPDQFINYCKTKNLVLINKNLTKLNSGKEFMELIFRKL